SHPGSAAVTSWSCSAPPPRSVRPWPVAATTWPGRPWRRGARWSPPRTSWSSWSPTGCRRPVAASGVPAPHPTPPGWPVSHAGRGVPPRPPTGGRSVDRGDAPVVDVRDASGRLVALDRRHVDRANAEGFLKSGKQMFEVAEEIARLSGLGETDREAH